MRAVYADLLHCYMLYPVHTTNLNAIEDIGRSDLFLESEIVKNYGAYSVAINHVAWRYGDGV